MARRHDGLQSQLCPMLLLRISASMTLESERRRRLRLLSAHCGFDDPHPHPHSHSHSPSAAPSFPFRSWTVPTCLRGTVSRCTFALGDRSWNAMKSSDSRTTLKDEGCPAGGMLQNGHWAGSDVVAETPDSFALLLTLSPLANDPKHDERRMFAAGSGEWELLGKGVQRYERTSQSQRSKANFDSLSVFFRSLPHGLSSAESRLNHTRIRSSAFRSRPTPRSPETSASASRKFLISNVVSQTFSVNRDWQVEITRCDAIVPHKSVAWRRPAAGGGFRHSWLLAHAHGFCSEQRGFLAMAAGAWQHAPFAATNRLRSLSRCST